MRGIAGMVVLGFVAVYVFLRYQEYTCKKGNYADSFGQCPNVSCSFFDFLLGRCNGVKNGY